MLQFDLQFYEELTVAQVKTVKLFSGAFFWPTGQLVIFIKHVSMKPYMGLFKMFWRWPLGIFNTPEQSELVEN